MSTHIEWADLRATSPTLNPPGEASDGHGNTNDLPALFAGDGVVIEGTPFGWLRFALRLADSARQYIADDAAELAGEEPGELASLASLRASLRGALLAYEEQTDPNGYDGTPDAVVDAIADAAKALLDALDGKVSAL